MYTKTPEKLEPLLMLVLVFRYNLSFSQSSGASLTDVQPIILKTHFYGEILLVVFLNSGYEDVCKVANIFCEHEK